MIAASIVASVGVSVAMDVILLAYSAAPPTEILIAAALFNGTVILQSTVGGIIEWRRPGHTIGRLLMLSGPLYAFLAAGWITASTLQPLVDPRVYKVVNWAGSVLSWPGVALIIGWVPLLFPTGTLPGPRWRIPAGVLVVVSGIGLAALAVRPGPLNDGTGLGSPIAIEGWPSFLQVFVDAIPLELLALVVLAVTALIVRYRRGDRVERLQVRWFAAAVTICGIGLAGTAVQAAIRTDTGPLVMTLVLYAGILAMPIAIGIAVTRYRLYEIDRLISRTIAYATVTGILAVTFAGTILVFQALLAPLAGGTTVGVAASTLVVAALFQPLRRRVQRVVDRQFNRARYDAEQTAAAFATRLRDDVDLGSLRAEVRQVVTVTVAPVTVDVWIRQPDART
jgi:hypothetical protein